MAEGQAAQGCVRNLFFRPNRGGDVPGWGRIALPVSALQPCFCRSRFLENFLGKQHNISANITKRSLIFRFGFGIAKFLKILGDGELRLAAVLWVATEVRPERDSPNAPA